MEKKAYFMGSKFFTLQIYEKRAKHKQKYVVTVCYHYNFGANQ